MHINIYFKTLFIFFIILKYIIMVISQFLMFSYNYTYVHDN